MTHPVASTLRRRSRTLSISDAEWDYLALAAIQRTGGHRASTSEYVRDAALRQATADLGRAGLPWEPGATDGGGGVYAPVPHDEAPPVALSGEPTEIEAGAEDLPEAENLPTPEAEVLSEGAIP